MLIGINLEALANILINDGFYPEAIEDLKEARAIFAAEGYREGVVRTMTSLGRRTEARDMEAAIAIMEEAVRLVSGTPLDAAEARLQQYLGRAYLRAGALDRSRAALQRSLDLSRKLSARARRRRP